MKARSMSHTAITVANFDQFVQFYAKHFGCRLVGVSDSDPARVRSFFGVEAPPNQEPKCKIGWLRTPGGGMLEIFEFTPQKPRQEVEWSRVGMTHFSLDVKDCYKWHDYLSKQGVTIVSDVERSTHGHTFFFIKDCDGNLIELIDLKIRYPALKYLGWLGGWLFRRGMYKEHYG